MKISWISAVFAVLGLLAAAPAQSAPEAEAWDRWRAHDPASDRRVDHSAFDRFLARHVIVLPQGGNRVDYARVPAEGRAALAAYVAALAAVDVDGLNRPEQMAFWINLYNALTLKVVLDHWPVRSIRDIDISPGLFSDGPWGARLATVAGEALSLDDIEHRILRPLWRDPRVHYAVNCASVGCPDLAPRAYTGERLEAMLDEGARNYVNDPRGLRIDRRGRLVASRIYDWFADDFGGEAGVLAHLRAHVRGELKARLDGAAEIDAYAYDWRVNAPR